MYFLVPCSLFFFFVFGFHIQGCPGWDGRFLRGRELSNQNDNGSDCTEESNNDGLCQVLGSACLSFNMTNAPVTFADDSSCDLSKILFSLSCN